MALDIDGPPIYDPLVGGIPGLMSASWMSWFSAFTQTLTEFMGQNGIFIPKLTTAQRDDIQNPQLGQIIYNTTTNEYQGRKSIGGVEQWVNFDTTP